MTAEFVASCTLCSDSCAVCHLRIMISVKIPSCLLCVCIYRCCLYQLGRKNMPFKCVGCFLKCNPAFSPFSHLMDFLFEGFSNVSLIYSYTKYQMFILRSMFLKIQISPHFSPETICILAVAVFVCVPNQSGVTALCGCMCACVWLLVLMLFDRKVQQATEQEDSVGSPVALHHHHHQEKLMPVVSAF